MSSKTSRIQTTVPHTLMHNSQHPPPLLPLTMATKDIAIATAVATIHTRQEAPPPQPPPVLPQVNNQKVFAEKTKKSKPLRREEKAKVVVPKTQAKTSETEEKRPRTTEWEKFADMLAQHRKFNPHDAFRRNGTLTKFGAGGAYGQLREKPSHIGHYLRGAMDDDSSDTISNFRSSPANSQRSSARVGGRVQRLPNRPNTGNNRKNHHEFSNLNGSSGRHQTRNRRNSNIGGGRKFDFNPSRSRVNDFTSSVSSDPIYVENSLQLSTIHTPHIPYAPSSTTTSHLYESVKSPANMRSHHSRSDSRQLPPLEPLDRTSALHQQRFNPDYDLPQQSAAYSNETTLHLTRESSNTSLFSNSSCEDTNHHNQQSQSFKKSALDLRLLSTNPPVKNTSSFLATPRSTPFSIRKSYTDLYFSTTCNKENKLPTLSDKSLKVPKSLYNSGDKTPYKVHKHCDVCNKKYTVK